MIKSRIQIGDGPVLDTYKAYGLIYMDADKRTEAPIKGRAKSSYAEEPGAHIDPRTVPDTFDYTANFLIEAPNKDMRNANAVIATFNKALYTQEADSDIRRYKTVTFYNDRDRVKIVGIPEPIAEPKSFYRRQDGSLMDCVEVELKIQVSDPTKCDFNRFRGGGDNLLRNTNQGARMWTLSFPQNKGNFSGVHNYTTKGIRFINEMSTVVDTNSAWQLAYYSLSVDKLIQGRRYTLSFKAKASNTPTDFNIQIRHISQSNALTPVSEVSLTTSKTLYKIPLTIGKTPDAGVDYKLCFYIKSSIVWGDIDLWDLKLEEGNVATEWLPSPDDFDYNPQDKALVNVSGQAEQTMMLNFLDN